ncbi:hypothetical protein RGF97_10805 [Streptomyces roseicoloratus]|uniref:ABM domain-containing protein n=1 Tax=Streptomyces roseicoloratus TaxID=2508722 RepID=A0ABY9RTG4_9ACTN|nr:antibiotic biosynthesis monooxygenase [Streptomyces roseicoloratus]WMX45242.1 hypothetical protein RGF97_10805 [Streptomyces roseicoloratus]
MYVRSLYMTGDPAKVDGFAETVRTKGFEMLSPQPGFRGMGVFADRELGKLLVGSWWEDEASRQASDEALSSRRSEMMAPFAQTMTIDNWEAPVARRAEGLGPEACFRLVRMDVDPTDVDLLVDTFRDTSLPKAEKVPGLAGISLLVDRAHGRAAVGALYRDADALASSRGTIAAIRGESETKARATTRSLEEFAVVMATAVPHG